MNVKMIILSALISAPLFLSSQVISSLMSPATLLAQNNDETVTNGRINKNMLLNSGLKIVMKDFEFEIDFYILNFDVSVADGPYEYSVSWKEAGTKPAREYAAFNQKQKTIMSRLKSGSRVTIENILVRGSDGRTRYLNPVTVRIR